MEITIVMDYLELIRDGEDKLRKIESSSQKHGPPAGMSDQAWTIDRAYLLFMLRLYARKIYYELWGREANVGLQDADFSGMWLILKHREEEVKKEHSLQSFIRVIDAFKLDPKDGATPIKLEKVLVYVIDKRPKLDREDYVYLATYLSGYAGTALNKGQGDYASVSIRSQVSVIEGKYGEGWKKGDQALAYRLLTNLANSAMNVASKNRWRGLNMDLVPDLGEESNAYEWIEELLKAYKSRLEKEYQKPSLAYVRARSAFFQKDYVKGAKELMTIYKLAFEFFGPHIRRLRLMTYYELLYCQGIANRPLARRLEPNVKATISNMRSNLSDMEVRQERQTFQVPHFRTFLDGFSALLSAREKAEKMIENSEERFRYLHTERSKLLKQLRGYDHFSGIWLRRQARELN